MKILFFPQYITTPHFETELELILNHIIKGDDVHVIFCRGEMKTCLNNINHDPESCIACKSTVKLGLKAAKVPRKKLLYLPRTEPFYKVIARKFHDIKELVNFSIDGLDLGAAAASTLVFNFNKEPKLDMHAYSREVYRELKMGWYVYNSFLDIVKKLNPDIVYIFNGRFTGARMMMRACEQLHIDFFTHERGGIMNRYQLRKNALPHNIEISTQEMLDRWHNTSDNREEIAREWYLERRRGVDQSFHSFTKNQTVGSLPKNFDKSLENIAIFNSSLEENVGIPGWQIELYEDDLVGIRKILEYFQDDPKYHFYLRVHPNLRNCHNSQVMEIEKLGDDFKNLTVIPAESLLHSYTLLDNCSKIMVTSSTIGIEATFYGKPVILIGRAMYENLDCCYRPKSHEEVIALLKSDLEPKSKTSALMYAYWIANLGIPFKFFKQTGVITGTFLGKIVCKMPILAFLGVNFLKLLKIRTLSKKVDHLKEMLNAWIFPKVPLLSKLTFTNIV